MNPRPDLIVPIRDRRQHKRYLTLRNFAIASAVAFVAFIAVSIYSEVRRPAPNDYGRLARKLPDAPPPTRPVEVVKETNSIADESAADPTLVQPMARAQWLGDETTSAGVIEPAAPATVSTFQRGEDVVVVGGPEGVTIVKQKRRKPVLSGGFGR
jgi:hypothetical protein